MRELARSKFSECPPFRSQRRTRSLLLQSTRADLIVPLRAMTSARVLALAVGSSARREASGRRSVLPQSRARCLSLGSACRSRIERHSALVGLPALRRSPTIGSGCDRRESPRLEEVEGGDRGERAGWTRRPPCALGLRRARWQPRLPAASCRETPRARPAHVLGGRPTAAA
jgi:hypothetical protein